MSRLPVIRKRAVWHIGPKSPKRQRSTTSHEGLAFSVSEHPEEWAQIAKIGIGEVWKLTPKPPRRHGVFLDVHALSKDQRIALTQAAIASGLLAKERRWKVTSTDPDDGRKMWFYVSSEADAVAEAEGGEGEDVQFRPVLVPVPTAKLDALWKERYEYDLPEMLGKTAAWQVVVERDHPELDGFWWNDELDPYGLSAPRGGIFYSKLELWDWKPSSVEEAEDMRGNPADKRLVCSWCGTASGPVDAPISHGCCSECKPKVEEQIRAAHEIMRAKKAKDDGEKKANDPGWWQAVHHYVSPRERDLTPVEAWVRAIAYGIKNGDESSIRTAVRGMAPLVPRGSFVIPAPASRAWSFGGVAKLAEAIARAVDGVYATPVSRTRTVDSSHERRKTGGLGLTVEEHVASMESLMKRPCPTDKPIVVIDNVATSGATLNAVRRLLGEDCDVRAVVWAEADGNSTPRANPPEIDGVLRGRTFWHGVDTEDQGRFTLGRGIVPRQEKQGRGLMAPVAGRVYLSPSLGYGAIYAVGGDVLGSESSVKYVLERSGSRYGYLFEVKGDDLLGRDVQPDEDSVGEMAAKVLRGRTTSLLWLGDMARRYLTERQLDLIQDGMYAHWAAAGKKLVKRMSPWQKAAVIQAGAHVAVAGAVRPVRAWRIDKTRNAELKRDGSNFLEIAEPIGLAIENPRFTSPLNDFTWQGGCFSLAVAVERLAGWKAVGVAVYDGREEFVWHAMNALPDGRLVDGRGIWEADEVLDEYMNVGDPSIDFQCNVASLIDGSGRIGEDDLETARDLIEKVEEANRGSSP